MSKEVINLSEGQIGIVLDGVFIKSEAPVKGSYGIMINQTAFLNNNCKNIAIGDTRVLVSSPLFDEEFFIKTNYVQTLEGVYTVKYAEYSSFNGDYYLVDNPFKK
jgi:hypothetical protein